MSDAVAVMVAALASSPVLVVLVKSILGRSRQPNMEAMATRVVALETRLDLVEARGRHQDDYIEDLRRHISEELGPPPPAWPAALTAIPPAPTS